MPLIRHRSQPTTVGFSLPAAFQKTLSERKKSLATTVESAYTISTGLVNQYLQVDGEMNIQQSIFRSDMGYACASTRVSVLPVLLAGLF